MDERSRFADFLDRLADNRSSPLEWERFVVAHYADAFLEEMRRCTVRLMQNRLPYQGNTEPGREALRCWAMAIRSASDSHPTNDIALTITPHEAVVLDDFLRRFSTTDELKIEHPAEQQTLWNLECVMEKCDNRLCWPSLADSRAALSPQED
ncbi:MAG: hypothetical protein R3C12_17655 [Planctomycetaceae bacterium]